MDFDHRNETTKVGSVAEMVANGKGQAAILEEISKCDLVCCMCHRIRTWNRLHGDDQIQGSDVRGRAARL